MKNDFSKILCSHCNVYRAIDQFFNEKGKRLKTCNGCRSRQKKYQQNHPEKINAAINKWQHDNPEKKKAYSRKWHQNHPEYNKIRVQNMSKGYIQNIMRHKYKIPNEFISDDMIERERELIKINRQFRSMKNV